MAEPGGKALSLVPSLLATKSPDRDPSKTCKEAGGQAASLCFLHVGGLKKDSCPQFSCWDCKRSEDRQGLRFIFKV